MGGSAAPWALGWWHRAPQGLVPACTSPQGRCKQPAQSAFPASACSHFFVLILQNDLIGGFVLFPGTLRKDLAGLLALDDSKKPNKVFKDDKEVEAVLYFRVSPSPVVVTPAALGPPPGQVGPVSPGDSIMVLMISWLTLDSPSSPCQISADFLWKATVLIFYSLSALSCQIETSHGGMFFFQWLIYGKTQILVAVSAILELLELKCWD